MPELDRKLQQDLSTSIEELFGSDGELREFIDQPRSTNFEKKKAKPGLYSMLMDIHHHPTENSAHIIEVLHAITDRFIEQDAELRGLVKSRMGCNMVYPGSFRYKLAEFFLGPATSISDTADERRAKYKKYDEEGEKIAELVKGLDHNTKVICIGLKILGFQSDSSKPRPIGNIVKELSDFFEDMEIEEALLSQSSSRRTSDKLE